MCCEGCRSWSALRILSLHLLPLPPSCPLSSQFNLDTAAPKPQPPLPPPPSLLYPWPYSNLTHKTADMEPERRGREITCMLIGAVGGGEDGRRRAGLRWGSGGAAGNLEGRGQSAKPVSELLNVCRPLEGGDTKGSLTESPKIFSAHIWTYLACRCILHKAH